MSPQEYYQAAADLLGCDVAAVQAVAEVESSGVGFLKDGRLRILFEGHVFHKYTSEAVRVTAPADICHPKWTKVNYCKGSPEERGAGEWARLERAKALDREAALMSCSIGKFQVMGFNYAACGYASVYAFWAGLSISEGAQLKAFSKFVMANKAMHAALVAHDWAGFAKRYNGPGYAANKYDVKLAEAHRRYVNNTTVAA